MYPQFTHETHRVTGRAAVVARALQCTHVIPDLLLYGILDHGTYAQEFARHNGITKESISRADEFGPFTNRHYPNDIVPFSPEAIACLDAAASHAAYLGHDCVEPEHVLLGYLDHSAYMANDFDAEVVEPDTRLLAELGLDPNALRSELWVRLEKDSGLYTPKGRPYGDVVPLEIHDKDPLTSVHIRALSLKQLHARRQGGTRPQLSTADAELLELLEPLDAYAQHALLLARHSADTYGHPYITASHLLHALRSTSGSFAEVVLDHLGITKYDSAQRLIDVCGRLPWQQPAQFAPATRNLIRLAGQSINLQRNADINQAPFDHTAHLLTSVLIGNEGLSDNDCTRLRIGRKEAFDAVITGMKFAAAQSGVRTLFPAYRVPAHPSGKDQPGPGDFIR